MSNVKAGKFIASQEDLESADYDEGNFEALNDVEKVLDSVGIKLRDNYSTWKDIDDVLSEIGEKWETWDQTTRNSVATVVAGTRQRENVVTLFANWSDVAKYAEIAKNAYGTATKKMEAYTVSVDASRERMTNAIQEMVLNLNQFSVLRDFYDVITFVIKNMWVLGGVLTAWITYSKADSVLQWGGGTISRLASRMMDAGNSGMVNSGNRAGAKGFHARLFGNIENNLEQGYLLAEEQTYAKKLTSLTATMEARKAQGVQALQAGLLHLGVEDKLTVSQTLLGQTVNRQLTQEGAQEVASALLNTATNQKTRLFLRAVANGQIEDQAILSYISNIQEGTTTQEKINIALNRELQAIADDAAVREQIARNLQTSKDSKVQSKIATLAGIGQVAGNIGGAVLGSQLANAYGIEGAGQIFAGIGGMALGSTVLKGGGALLGAAITQTSGAAALGAAFPSLAAIGTVVPQIAVTLAAIAAAVGIIALITKNNEKKAKETARQSLSESLDKYNNAKGLSVVASQYEELAKGVDAFGNNVSLSEDDYAKFIEDSQKLVEIFPELYVGMNSNGDAIAFLGDAASTASEKVEGLIESLKNDVDFNLINPYNFQQAIDDVVAQQQVILDTANHTREEAAKKYHADVVSGRIGSGITTGITLPSTMQKKNGEYNAIDFNFEGLEKSNDALEIQNDFLDEYNKKQAEVQESSQTTWKQVQYAQDQATVKISALNNELGETAQAYAKYFGYYEGLSAEQASILSASLTGIKAYNEEYDENGILVKLTPKSQEDYAAEVAQIAGEINQLLEEHPEFIEIAAKAMAKEGYVGEIEQARKDLIDALI